MNPVSQLLFREQYCLFITLLVISGEGPDWIKPVISGQLLIIRILSIGPLQAF